MTLPSSRLDLLSLRLLLVAMEEGNLARTAERENIALSGVSRRITDLEQRWGVQLLHRHDRGVRPTAAANMLIPKIRQAFELLDGIMADVAAIGSGARGLLRLHANMTALAGDLASHIAQLSAAHPELVVELEEATTVDIIQALRSERCDIGIVSDTVDMEGLHQIPWLSDELVAVLPTGHALAGEPSLRFEAFLDYPFVGMQHDSALQRLYRAKAAEFGRELDERVHVTSFATAARLVSAGCGISILPRVALAPDSPYLSIRPLDERWASRNIVMCVRSSQLTPAQSLCIEFLRGFPAGH